MWRICGQKLEAGEKKQINLEPGMKEYIIPTTLVCGAKPGKTLLVTAGIHAGEYYIYALCKYQWLLETHRGDHSRGWL